MDRTPCVSRPAVISHGLAPALGWGTATFVIVSPFVSLVADGLGHQGGFAPLIPIALPVTVGVAASLRRFPLPTVALLLASAVVTALLFSGLASTTLAVSSRLTFTEMGPAMLAVCYVAATRPGRAGLSALCLVLGTLIGYEAYQVSDGFILGLTQNQLPIAGDAAFAWLIGYSIQQHGRYAEASRAQATEQAITTERLRIARELHDMVAHSIGIIAIQAGMGSRVIDRHPAQAREALDAIETTSREALSGLRRTLVALRRTDSVGASKEGRLAAAPGLEDLDRLAATTADAGVRVEVCRRGARRPLPPDIELSAYRIVQEAVTNVVRHAGTGYCRVAIEYGEEELSVEVLDDGCGTPGGAGGKGFGILGIRERVNLLHGDFSAGPRPEGGFRVAARLPLPERTVRAEPVAAAAVAEADAR